MSDSDKQADTKQEKSAPPPPKRENAPPSPPISLALGVYTETLGFLSKISIPLAVVYLIVTYDTDVGEYLEKYPITSMEVAGQRFEFGVMAMNSAFNVAQFVERTPQDTPEAKSAVVNQVQVQEQLSRKAAELGVIPSKTIEGVRVDEAEEEELLAKEAKLVPPIASQDSKNFKWVSQLGIS